jgi:transcriptional regulator with XRE-family HTH domain
MGTLETEDQRRPRSASALDKYVGVLVKARREQVGMSQSELASKLGISFQQLQKYERGQNRISAGRLFELADVLGVEISWFYQGAQAYLAEQEQSALERAQASLAPSKTPLETLVAVSGSAHLLEAYAALGSNEIRRKAVSMMQLLSQK